MEMAETKSENPSNLWRVFNIIMCLFFSLAAYVNYNDDDWYVWVPIYTVPALLSVSAAIKPSFMESQSWKRLIYSDLAICFLYSLYQMFALYAKLSSNLQNPLTHEEGREMGGLLVILVWAGIARYMSSENARSDESSHWVTLIIFWITSSLAIIPLFLWSLCFIDDWHQHYGHCSGMFQKQQL